MLHRNLNNPDSKCNWVMDSLEKGWKGKEDHFWGFIGSNETNINVCKATKRPWFFWDMPYYGRWHKDIQDDFYWRVGANHIHYRFAKAWPNDRFKAWNVTPREYGKGTKILICPSSETMTRYVTGMNVQQWLDWVIEQVTFYCDRPYEIRQKPRANGTSGPSVADIPFAEQAKDTHCVITCVSLCALEAQLLGIPTICHKDSFARDVSSWHIEEINQPKKFDTTQWFNNLEYSKFTHKEIEAGLPEEVFKESGIPIERYIQYA